MASYAPPRPARAVTPRPRRPWRSLPCAPHRRGDRPASAPAATKDGLRRRRRLRRAGGRRPAAAGEREESAPRSRGPSRPVRSRARSASSANRSKASAARARSRAPARSTRARAETHSIFDPHQTSMPGSASANSCILRVAASWTGTGAIAEASQNLTGRPGGLRSGRRAPKRPPRRAGVGARKANGMKPRGRAAQGRRGRASTACRLRRPRSRRSPARAAPPGASDRRSGRASRSFRLSIRELRLVFASVMLAFLI